MPSPPPNEDATVPFALRSRTPMSELELDETAFCAEAPTRILPSARTARPAASSELPGDMLTTTLPSTLKPVSSVPFGWYFTTTIRCSKEAVWDIPATRMPPEPSRTTDVPMSLLPAKSVVTRPSPPPNVPSRAPPALYRATAMSDCTPGSPRCVGAVVAPPTATILPSSWTATACANDDGYPVNAVRTFP